MKEKKSEMALTIVAAVILILAVLLICGVFDRMIASWLMQ